MRKPRQPRLNMRVDPGTPLPESHLQAQILRVLCGLGYTVLETGAYRARVSCPECGETFFPAGANGNTPGVADLLVSRCAWGHGLPIWAGLEVKTRSKTGKLSHVRERQKLLAEQGRNVIVASVAEAVDAMLAVEQALGQSHPRLETFWDNNPRRLFV